MIKQITKIPFLTSLTDLSSLVIPPLIQKNKSSDISHTLITGANGFLALFLIEQLVGDEKVKKISCFVRNIEKFKKEKEKLGLSFSEEKIKFIIFDNFFEQPDPDKISYLETVTQFIHNAAQVHNLKNANQLWDSNITLTLNFLSLWQQTKHDASFHLISTLSVFASSLTEPLDLKEERKIITENCLAPDSKTMLVGGYAQTKWICEFLLSQYENSHIIRLGLLTPSTTNSIFRENEFLTDFLNLIQNLDYLPYKNAHDYKLYACDIFVDLSPVNEVAYNIIKLLGNKKILHIANSQSLNLYSIAPGNKPYLSNEDWEHHIDFLKISKINKILLKNSFLRHQHLFKNISYFNLDLFQSTRHDWSNNSAIMSKPQSILKHYLNYGTIT